MAITLKTINASILEGNEDIEQLNSNFQKWFDLQKRSRLDDLEKNRELRKLLGTGGGAKGKRGMTGLPLPFSKKPGGKDETSLFQRILAGLGYGVGGAVAVGGTAAAFSGVRNMARSFNSSTNPKFLKASYANRAMSEGRSSKFGNMTQEQMRVANAEVARQKLLKAQLAETRLRSQQLKFPNSKTPRLLSSAAVFPTNAGPDGSILRRRADTTRFNATYKPSAQSGRDGTLTSKLNSIRYVANGQAILEYKNKAGKLKGIRLMVMTPAGLQPTGPLIKPNTIAFKTVINTGALPPV